MQIFKSKIFYIILGVLLGVATSATAVVLLTSNKSTTQTNLSQNVSADSYTDTYGTWTYSVSGGQATISKYSGSAKTIVIPSSINNYPVVKLFNANTTSVFNAVKSTMTSVTIPESITTLGAGAFYNCTALTEINFNATNCADLETGNNVFYCVGSSASSSGYTTLNIGPTVQRIPAYIFSLSNTALNPYIKTINFNAINCADLPSNLPWLYTRSSTVDVIIGNGVTRIPAYLFNGCTQVSDITISSSVTAIGNYAFQGCTKLATIDFEAGSTCSNIGDYAFSGCTTLTGVTIPNSVTTIGKYAFSGCTAMKSAALGKGVTSVGQYAFNGCTALSAVSFFRDYSKDTSLLGIAAFANNSFTGENASTVYRFINNANVAKANATTSVFTTTNYESMNVGLAFDFNFVIMGSSTSLQEFYVYDNSTNNVARVAIVPLDSHYVSQFSFDNSTWYDITNYKTLNTAVPFAYSMTVYSKNGSNIINLEFEMLYTHLSTVPTVYLKTTTAMYESLNENLATSGTQSDLAENVVVSATYGGTATIVGDNYSSLEAADWITCSATVCVKGYQFIGWFYHGDDYTDLNNRISADKSYRFSKEQAYEKHLVAYFAPI